MGLLILLLCFFASLAVGAADISLGSIYTAFTAFDGSTEHLIIRTVRLPRSLIATFVGAALAVAGAIMQGITHNPLASPSILGVNAGAAFAVVVATFIFGSSSLSVYAWFAFLGAGITAVMVYLLGSLGRGGLTSLNLTIAGAALTAFISSITSGILIISQRTLEEIRFWIAGSIAGRELDLFMQVLPYLGVGLLLAFALGRQITTLSLGEDVAKGLGQQTAWVKIAAAVSVVLLAGGSVAIAGPIGFIGLIIPHMSRFLVGVDYRWILPYAPMLGAILLLVADTCARIVIQPQELPVGLVMPLIGAPFFIYLIRSKVKR
ncbi:MAG: iron ABC transporter permease [Cyanobacteria bacterium QS_7_48_42]|jgi:iron complex transport system permease protein|nr:MAG: iron ABC transporter permease [Cyanobacteria bacterium QH_7_48_89]PSO70082.1 MAG: iron ABC transporter permease [Cyanobacteria bacterium QH_3_48_40]PSO93201.1 MAG: iron ABC transporter permease [Cyanobacteria bacterium QS_9_48_30]PSP02250.1 MAG: iron ABC transporter permease [Cyanobacteria bacterium QS_7_48_42]PSP03138.1 MAG: iron ABC transporter permease [Cyanobacteria bacterium SW_12_48_29]PSP06756.1 MAG: iron ABC transporter permease [Cyanobacteria bacterium SW_7_48_12]PSP18257.1 M